jgi:hypothetical protein
MVTLIALFFAVATNGLDKSGTNVPGQTDSKTFTESETHRGSNWDWLDIG